MSPDTGPTPLSSEAVLRAAYQEWCRVADAEAEAIRKRRWSFVCECETTLRRLQDRILVAIQSAQATWASQGVNSQERSATVRLIFSGLIERQAQNQALLEEHHRKFSAATGVEPPATWERSGIAPPSRCCPRRKSRRVRS
jgi:hypothetical protein